MNPPAHGHDNYHISFFLFVYEKKGMPLGYSPKTMETITDSSGIIASNWILWRGDTPLALEPLLPLAF